MNCDQVFDVLTRGPFPTGGPHDAAVEAHLSGCPECHRLAEALRPALELFQEAVAPEETHNLPGYWCAVAPERSQQALSYADDLEPATRPRLHVPPPAPTRGLPALTAWRLAAAVALGVTLGSIISTRGGTPSDRQAPPAATPPMRQLVVNIPNNSANTDFKPRLNLASLKLPNDCYEQPHGLGQPDDDSRGLALAARTEQCCSRCHNNTSERVRASATNVVAQHCQDCHH